MATLNRYGISSLRDKIVLDVGCGAGGELRNLLRYGAQPEKLFGIDLLPERIAQARVLSPNVDFCCGDASMLPYPDEFFDMIMQLTVFTSIIDLSMKEEIAGEMHRVLKPDGIILWYDYHMANPRDMDVKRVKKSAIYALFPQCTVHLERITLAQPLAKRLVPYSPILCCLLEKIPFLCTHYLGIIRKRAPW